MQGNKLVQGHTQGQDTQDQTQGQKYGQVQGRSATDPGVNDEWVGGWGYELELMDKLALQQINL